MRFTDVVGQAKIKEQLINSALSNRISHAFLFIGKQGVGKLATAIAFAQYINCLNPTENDSCNECSSCKKFNKILHPDLHFIFPINKTKDIQDSKIYSLNFYEQWFSFLKEFSFYPSLNDWYDYINIEKKQGIINADEADSIKRKIELKSYVAKYKVIIIWMADKMNIVAANKLLKNLEEPSDNTIFILITEKPNDLLDTILSRTQKINFNQLSNDEIIESLEKKFNIDQAQLKQIAYISNGNYSRAIKQAKNILYDDNVLSENFVIFRDWMRNNYKFGRNISNYQTMQESIETIIFDGNRDKIKSYLIYCLELFHICFNFNIGNQSIAYHEGEELTFIESFSKYIHSDNINTIEKEINKAIFHIERNVNPLLTITDLSLQISQIIHIPNVKG